MVLTDIIASHLPENRDLQHRHRTPARADHDLLARLEERYGSTHSLVYPDAEQLSKLSPAHGREWFSEECYGALVVLRSAQG